MAGCRLGPWAATVSNEDDRQPGLAIDVGTYLTVAFPLGEPSGFHDAFGAAVGAALEDLGVAAGQIQIEVEAVKTLSRGNSTAPLPRQLVGATVVGRAALITDAAEKQKDWKADRVPIYPKGTRDDGFMLIRLTPTRLEIVSESRGMVADPKAWLPLAIEFPSPRR